MRVWLINVGEIPFFESKQHRRMRMGQICSALLEAGDTVTYWTSTFIHTEKRNTSKITVVESCGDNLTVVRLRSKGYKKHISFARFFDQICVAKEFRYIAPLQPLPDVILCSYPTIELAHEAVRFARARGIPIIIDVRDMWPDIFEWFFPRFLTPLVHAALAPYRHMARTTLADATAVTGITDAFVEWAIRLAKRRRSDNDQAFHFCYEPSRWTDAEAHSADEFWRRQGVFDGNKSIVLFIGSFNRTFNLRPIVACARKMSSSPDGPLFILCGSGDMEDVYRREAEGLQNVIMPGWINAAQIWRVLQIAKVAIGPLPDRPDFHITVNNKFVEYLSGSLPILVSPPESYAARLVMEYGCGRGFDLADPEALAVLLSEILSDDEQLSRMRNCARKLFQERFGADQVLPRWVSYLHHVGCRTICPREY